MTARHYLLRVLVAFVLLLATVIVAGVLIFQSGWFREMVRARMVRELEKATGGRAELANFSFDWRRLTATVTPLILHGKETSAEEPLLRVESVNVGLKIISAFERKVDLAFLRVEKPALHLIIYPDGSTNFPSPATRQRDGNWPKQLLDTAIGSYEITGGFLTIDSRRVPFALRGEDLRAVMNYQGTGNQPHYDGELSASQVQLTMPGAPVAAASIDTAFSLDEKNIRFSRLNLSSGKSRAELVGSLTDLKAPRGTFSAKSLVNAGDVIPLLGVPITVEGTVQIDGDLSFTTANTFRWSFMGQAEGTLASLASGTVRVVDTKFKSAVKYALDRLDLRDIEVTSSGTTMRGDGSLYRKDAHFTGEFSAGDIRDLARVWAKRAIPWSGNLNGTITADAVLGSQQAKVQVRAFIAPAVASAGAVPLEGDIDLAFDQGKRTINLGVSYLATNASRLDLSGVLGQMLDVRARSTNLADVATALAVIQPGSNLAMPISLNGGEAALAGAVSGPLDNPAFRGQLSVTNALVQGHALDRFSALVTASRSNVVLQQVILTRGSTRVTGNGQWNARGDDVRNGPVTAHIEASGVSAEEIAKEFNVAIPASAFVNATANVSGTLGNPVVEAVAEAPNVSVRREHFDRVRADFIYAAPLVTIRSLDINSGSGRIGFRGEYRRSPGATGDLNGILNVQNVLASRLAFLQANAPEVEALLNGNVNFDAAIHETQLGDDPFTLRSLNGNLSAAAITLSKEPVGQLNLTASSNSGGQQLSVHVTGRLRDSEIVSDGQWPLNTDRPGQATFRFSQVSVDTLHDLVFIGARPGQKTPVPFDGFFAGTGTVAIALAHPSDFQAEVRIDTFQLGPKPSQNLRLDVQPQDLLLRNEGPLLLAANASEVRIRSARFIARDTNLEASGAVPFSPTGAADLAIRGTVNLSILQLLNPDLLAKGNATVATTIRGSIRDPLLNGRMELNGASLYLADTPNGIDSASGVVLFDRNRATIERLTAQTGGGELAIRGFLEFGQPLVYRLQANARQVRVRYPEDVSLSANAQLALTGTSESSILSGTLTLNRAAISPGADLGRLLANAAAPAATSGGPNEYLSGVRLDIRVDSAPTFVFETSLTRNVESEVDLRMRGTLLQPVLAGTISASSGELQVFGNRYTVNRADMRFLNPLKIEPVLDLNLETRTRGIVVTVAVTGTPQKLNINYSSDPPMQSREIIALLASGADPNTSSSSSTQVSASAASFGSAGGIIGEAVSEQLSSRFQRFFGASRVKIDPTLTSVDTLPAARLTLEQQVSRDITLTYTTNLNRTSEQIVRVQWDVSQTWSAVAVRDANGFFGIDVQYRKRFK